MGTPPRGDPVPAHGGTTARFRVTLRWANSFPAVIWAIIAASIALSVASAATIPLVNQRTASHWLTRAQAMQEYKAEARQLQLPAAWSWPESLPGFSEAAAYQEGFAAGRADLYWFVAWSTVAVSPQLPAATRQDALAQLSHIYQTPFFRNDLVERAAFKDMIERAQHGDLSDLQSFVEANTPGGGE